MTKEELKNRLIQMPNYKMDEIESMLYETYGQVGDNGEITFWRGMHPRCHLEVRWLSNHKRERSYHVVTPHKGCDLLKCTHYAGRCSLSGSRHVIPSVTLKSIA